MKRSLHRPPRSSLAGGYSRNPHSRVARFDADAQAFVQFLQEILPQLREVNFGYISMPAGLSDTEMPKYYSIDRENRTIMLHRIPIQRAKVLHVDDDDHRKMFIGHVVYRAACEYLGESPWSLLPGHFDHY